MKRRLDFWTNDWAREAIVRAHTWRLASRSISNLNPMAESSIRFCRSMMRNNALDAVNRAKYARKMKEAA